MTDTPTTTDYAMLSRQLEALLDGERDRLANTANFVALLWQALDDINWLGVYVLRGEELVLGPFQGRPACVRIPLGQGVCGTAAERRATERVADVHDFPGHIVCDPASRSEIVVPLLDGETLLGVLDVDSPAAARFSAEDQAGLEAVCRTFVAALADARADPADSRIDSPPGFI